MEPIKFYKNKWDRFTIIMTTLVLIVITIAVITCTVKGDYGFKPRLQYY